MDLLSDEEKVYISFFDLSSTYDMHDPRFGSTDFEICVTCQKGKGCQGHFAHLNLPFYIVHPLFHGHLGKVLENYCRNCLLFIQDEVCTNPPSTQTTKHISFKKFSVDNIKGIVKDDKSLMTILDLKYTIERINVLNHKKIREGLVYRTILIPPIRYRSVKDVEWPSDLSKSYIKLVDSIKQDKKREIIVESLSEVSDNIINGLLSGKDGIFRKIMLGKRVENSMRSVIIGNPSIPVDKVAIPKICAERILKEFICSPENIEECISLAKEGKLYFKHSKTFKRRYEKVSEDEVFLFEKYMRGIRNGDSVLLNRQPSLSKESMLGFDVIIKTDDTKTIDINPLVSTPFNADFDGDEMNIFAFDATDEIREKCHVKNHMKSIKPIQDLILIPYTKPEVIEKFLGRKVKIPLDKKELSYLIDSQETLESLQKLCIEIGYSTAYSVLLSDIAKSPQIEFPDIPKEKMDIKKELEIKSQLDEFRDRCCKIADDGLKNTTLHDMVASGSKGDILNLAQIYSSVGQQYVQGERIGRPCESSYFKGLSQEEFLTHAISAREGVVSTGINTADTGYLNRRVCKIIGDVVVDKEGFIGDQSGIVSFPEGF